jgi:hypothetical protein
VGNASSTSGTRAKTDIAVFIDGTFQYVVQPPVALTVPTTANTLTPFAISFAIALSPGVHSISLRAQNYEGAALGAVGESSPSLLTVLVMKQ